MTIAIGTDIVEIQRIASALEGQGDKFTQRILISFQHMVVSNNSEGAPQVELQDNAAERLKQLGGTNVLLSLSDEKNYALAYVAIT